ncbi:hypothetical protein ACROYT_G014597 [Oculina patagonica]
MPSINRQKKGTASTSSGARGKAAQKKSNDAPKLQKSCNQKKKPSTAPTAENQKAGRKRSSDFIDKEASEERQDEGSARDTKEKTPRKRKDQTSVREPGSGESDSGEEAETDEWAEKKDKTIHKHLRRRPQITEILDDKVKTGVSSSSLVDSMSLFRTLLEFSILAVSNKPVSHLVNAEVCKKALKVVADKIHRKGHAGDTLLYLLVGHSAFQMHAPDRGNDLNVSTPLNINNICVNDGDGIILGVDPDSGSPLQGAQYTRLNHVDALELFAVHYVRNEANNKSV